MSEPVAKKQKMEQSQLDQLKEMTKVVADTGDFQMIEKFKPVDATTNPSLILKASTMPEYKAKVTDAIAYAKENYKGDDEVERMEIILDRVCVEFGLEILKVVEGLVSTEVDARLSFDAEASVKRAKRIIDMYEAAGIKRDRVLIKLASTWEGIQAAKTLAQEGINCNLTLLFSFCQAVACAEADVALISPFVGRIRDWYQKANNKEYPAPEDPGVLSVQKIYNYYKKYGYNTVVMGASFRSKEEIIELAGCDKLTIGPNWLEELENTKEPIEVKLSPEAAKEADVGPKLELNEKTFRWMLNEDAMATEKLAEGIRAFAADIIKLEDLVKSLM
mmetsp:Transcript_6961/g.13907  ORF Transcript_6961/g.13907 Transcript_6961/m.13907 type:complete len:333 (+) Transcript_6961:54-1052(+)|eukprot:CAMPEP_0171498734 /NCGR_PEP_ID=MMETSP0958-20121227/8022_1 /TAXON_ID=87120 /ORGANISM="Aurantiochytrium limacinum, Strain ATCCMYA-1381" /LENGTH=332 /DNA_ID=CAMNT_0012033181 /DNA_START=57 /DNA_END=1055 /DNA_ORIENTATION=-